MKLLNKDEINYFKNNKDKITEELLNELRKNGDEGKHQALEILDLIKNDNNEYVDINGNAIGNYGYDFLKKPGTKLNLAEIHVKEIEKCINDFEYFRDNYIIIKKAKDLGFPDMREYQKRFIEDILKHDEIVAVMSRQCVGGETKIEGLDLSIEELFNSV